MALMNHTCEVMEMLQTSTWTMSCTAGGTRVVQKALEVADLWWHGSVGGTRDFEM